MSLYFYLALLVLPLAVWRVANMLADTDQSGPFDVLDWFRYACGMRYTLDNKPAWKHGSLADLISCADCSSVWLGLFGTIGLILLPEVTFFVSLPFALSAVAMLLETWKNRM